MPLITVSLYPGNRMNKKNYLYKKITESAVEILQTKPEHVMVVFDENPKDNWYLAGKKL